MADLLLRAPPHLSFSSCTNIFFFSSFKPLPSHSFRISSSSSQYSPGDKFDVISTSECSDGSVLFRFGDVSKIKKNLEKEKPKLIIKNAKQEVTDKDISDSSRKRIKFCRKNEEENGSNQATQALDSVHVTDAVVADEKSSDDGDLSASGPSLEVKGIERISYRILTPVNQSSDLDIARKGETRSTSLAIGPQLDMDSLEELSAEESEGETSSNHSNASLLRSDMDAPHSLAYQDVDENMVVEAAHLFAVSESNDVHIEASDDHGDKSNVIELVPELTSSKTEAFLCEKTTRDGNVGSKDNMDFEVKCLSGASEDCDAPREGNHVTDDDGGKSNAIELVPELTSLNTKTILNDNSILNKAENSWENAIDGVMQISGVGDDHVGNIEANDLTYEGCKSNVIELVPELTSLQNEAILEEKSTHNEVDAPVCKDKIQSLKILDDIKHSSNCKQQIAESDEAQRSSSNINVSIPHLAKLQTTDMTIPHVVESETIQATVNMEEIPITGLFLSSAAALFPHPFKALTGGEDAYFYNLNWLGVADGVGHWSLEGTNAGIYAQQLIQNCRKIVADGSSISIDPAELLNKAALETQSAGTSTALVAYFDGQAIHVANIGDSGFIILRNGTVFKTSAPMVHEINFPLQIKSGENPSERIEKYKVELHEGDVIITATDGLFDNLYNQEIASIVSKSLQAGLKPQEIAELLGTRAQEVGRSDYARSPFADALQAAGYVGYTGGKLDDVTVIVSLVQNGSTSLPSL